MPGVISCTHVNRNADAVQIRVKCNEDDTIGDLKKLVAAQTGASSFLCVCVCVCINDANLR